MPVVTRQSELEKVYAAAVKKISAGDLPTMPVPSGQVLYRSINPTSGHTSLPKPAPGGHVSKFQANTLLVPRHNPPSEKDRFTGPSGNTAIPGSVGLYFVLQQQALVNESTHYSRKAPFWALAGQCVLRCVVMGSPLVADLSPHNPRAKRFLKELGGKTWDEMVDPDDCSVARGIGLAVANSGFLHGMCVQTVRPSERSTEERGDNLVLFAIPGHAVPNLYIDQAYYFGKTSAPEIFPVAFP
jgi:hypothetical protein